ncbi:hypothetical protein MUK42_14074 [Musa troglodytarum]|uniref:Uncharacterized protein n=1 Tax=Musa troglodytarum TaxID=320322 RepID=A0A9E7JX63_9LILI|nr:hypothetical protein MUK42_14074 [Musa troglodytarum]
MKEMDEGGPWKGRGEDRLPAGEGWMWRSSLLAVKLKAVKAPSQHGVRVGKARPKAELLWPVAWKLQGHVFLSREGRE